MQLCCGVADGFRLTKNKQPPHTLKKPKMPGRGELPGKLVGEEVVAGEAVEVWCSEKRSGELEVQG